MLTNPDREQPQQITARITELMEANQAHRYSFAGLIQNACALAYKDKVLHELAHLDSCNAQQVKNIILKYINTQLTPSATQYYQVATELYISLLDENSLNMISALDRIQNRAIIIYNQALGEFEFLHLSEPASLKQWSLGYHSNQILVVGKLNAQLPTMLESNSYFNRHGSSNLLLPVSSIDFSADLFITTLLQNDPDVFLTAIEKAIDTTINHYHQAYITLLGNGYQYVDLMRLIYLANTTHAFTADDLPPQLVLHRWNEFKEMDVYQRDNLISPFFAQKDLDYITSFFKASTNPKLREMAREFKLFCQSYKPGSLNFNSDI